MKRNCTSLKEGESVIFNIYSDIYEEEIAVNGNVILVNKNKKVGVVWLEEYKTRNTFISFDDMLAIYNPSGETMSFDNISFKCDLFIPE